MIPVKQAGLLFAGEIIDGVIAAVKAKACGLVYVDGLRTACAAVKGQEESGAWFVCFLAACTAMKPGFVPAGEPLDF